MIKLFDIMRSGPVCIGSGPLFDPFGFIRRIAKRIKEKI